MKMQINVPNLFFSTRQLLRGTYFFITPCVPLCQLFSISGPLAIVIGCPWNHLTWNKKAIKVFFLQQNNWILQQPPKTIWMVGGIWKGMFRKFKNCVKLTPSFEKKDPDLFRHEKVFTLRRAAWDQDVVLCTQLRVVFLQNNPRKAPCRGIVKLVPLLTGGVLWKLSPQRHGDRRLCRF